MAPNQETKLLFPAIRRNIIKLPLPKEYFGNEIVKARDLENKSS
jgi:hypothetical protein